MKTSKQARKEPITTIAVNQSTILLLDEYIKDKNLSRKEFVEKSINYFVRTGFNLNESISELSPIQNAVEDFKQMQAKAENQNNMVMNILQNLYNMQKMYVQKALPAEERARSAEEYKTRYQKIKSHLILLSHNKSAIRVGKIKRIIAEYLDI